ncbi:MAG: methyltransferase domain-containing protein [Sulfurimonas sp.]|jgi:ubiquinone/menaquinone biosynthesis C-methylase UbiE
MADNEQIIKLYSELAEQPNKDFGWNKGLDNAKAHNYLDAWFEKLPSEIWKYCAAVGNPFEQGTIEEGVTVLDLGCGAGVDVLVSALLVGEKGRVIGVDITPKMVQKAREHVKLAGFTNVEILESSFENLELEDESVDVVISNGAINLTPCKESVFAEIYRVLKPDGKLMFADMIDIAEEEACNTCCSAVAEEGDWANCVAGTLKKEKLIDIMRKAGFGAIECTGINHYKTSDTTYGATFRAKKISSDRLRQLHWDTIFETKDYTQVLWHQNTPTVSLELINSYAKKEDFIIDVGCGASLLVDNLTDMGYKNITLLDTSKISLDIVKNRLGTKSENANFICSDIMHFESTEKFNIWHDRAVFHFLLLKKERARYFEVLQESLTLGGTAIINTFALGGQTECAGLKIVQYDYEKILQELPSGLELIRHEDFVHTTPKESEQAYSYFVIKKSYKP